MSLPPPGPDSTCLITGASSGIGADIARELAQRGHGVVLVARREERLRALADELDAAHGVRAEVLGCDLTDDAARSELVARVGELGLTIEVLVNNAGFGTAGSFNEIDADEELRMLRTNVEAVLALTHAIVPGMVARRRGAILQVASSAAFQPIPRQATYAATKAFVLSFSEALHTELRPHGITVTALCPGPVRTEFVEVAGLEDAAGAAPGFMWVDADECARDAVRGLERGKRVVVPNALIRATTVAAQHTPRSVLLRAMDRFYPV
jgi:short-subunit dehydrogenase